MEKRAPTDRYSLAEIARLVGGVVKGDAAATVARPMPAGSPDPEGITFAEGAKYLAKATSACVGAILVTPGTIADGFNLIEVERPRAAFGVVLALFDRPIALDEAIHPTAIIHPTAVVEENVSIGAYAVIERFAHVGAGSKIHPFCYIGENCVLDEMVTLLPHVVLYRDVEIGARTIVHAGTVLGADGFGYAWNGKEQMKVPQVGGVKIGDNVEIGALTAVDRATAGNTTIGTGTKIDNFVQVAHNVRIGEHTVIASFAALAGSTTVGSRVTIAGQVAANPHVTIGDDIILGGRTGVESDVLEPGMYFGLPAMPHLRAKRIMLLQGKLPSFVDRIKQLEKRIEELGK